MELNKLTVHHYADNANEEKRITLSPQNIVVAAAAIEDTQVNGRSVRNVTVLFVDGGSIDLVVNHSDLEMIEQAVGTYYFG